MVPLKWANRLTLGEFGGFRVRLKKIPDDPENEHQMLVLKRKCENLRIFYKMSQNDQELVNFDHFCS